MMVEGGVEMVLRCMVIEVTTLLVFSRRQNWAMRKHRGRIV